MHDYKGKYSTYWEKHFGLIPNLPASFDNANDIYELLAWLQRGYKNLVDDYINLELEFEEFKNAIIELLKVLIPQLIRSFAHSEEFREIIYNYIRDFIKLNEFRQVIYNLIRDFIKLKEFKEAIFDLIRLFIELEEFKEVIYKLIRDFIKLDEFRQSVYNFIRDFNNTTEFKNFIKSIIKDFNNTTEFKDFIKNIIKDFNNTTEFKDFIKNIIKDFNGTTDFEKFIKNIINKWYSEIVLNPEIKILEKNKDYQITFYNGFYDNDTTEIGFYENGDIKTIIIKNNSNIKNDRLTDVEQNHNESLTARPKSAIFGITFNGDYSFLNNSIDLSGNYNNGSGIFTVEPREARASWTAYYNFERNWNNAFTFSLRSYADGYNTQFKDIYPDDIKLAYSIFSYTLTLIGG